MKPSHQKAWFGQFAKHAAQASGHSIAFVTAAALILIWALTGPLFHFSDTWQLVVNTATTVVTFLMVFLIQHTQSRDSEVMQIKLDELIRAVSTANCALLNLEELSDQELEAMRAGYVALARQAQADARAQTGQAPSPAP